MKLTLILTPFVIVFRKVSSQNSMCKFVVSMIICLNVNFHYNGCERVWFGCGQVL